jgi:hypothetical protein
MRDAIAAVETPQRIILVADLWGELRQPRIPRLQGPTTERLSGRRRADDRFAADYRRSEPWVRYLICCVVRLYGGQRTRLGGPGFSFECRSGRLDPRFEFGHQALPRPARRYRVEKFEDDPAGPLAKGPASPKDAGNRPLPVTPAPRLKEWSCRRCCSATTPRRSPRSSNPPG